MAQQHDVGLKLEQTEPILITDLQVLEWMAQPLEQARFRVSPQILGPLGLEQLQAPSLAVLELVKNSWDADATEVTVTIKTGSPGKISVEDNGFGMSQQDFVNYWLVLGDTHKRKESATPRGRPLIGEKGLGRLACIALGSRILIKSCHEGNPAFNARVDWDAIIRSQNLEDTPILVGPAIREGGTSVEVSQLKRPWSDSDTKLLTDHIEFLAVPAPGDRFVVQLLVDKAVRTIATRPDILDQFAEAELEVEIDEDGVPRIRKANAEGKSFVNITFRGFPREDQDSRLAGSRIRLLFFRRTVRVEKASEILIQDRVKQLLEEYEGVRVFRDGINVPPYGLSGMDWAKLEKQRTSTGGPTMVPGNSQLIGEIHLSRERHKHLIVTAGRAGFTDQQAVNSLSEYVRWAARSVGTIRRAAQLGIERGVVPPRVDEKRTTRSDGSAIEQFKRVVHEAAKKDQKPSAQVLFDLVTTGKQAVKEFEQEVKSARIYAQLATAGASAASFAHELRKEFDLVDDSVDELEALAARNKALTNEVKSLRLAWNSIKGFVGLFKLIPIKVRREIQNVEPGELSDSLQKLVDGIPHTGIEVIPDIRVGPVRLAPAELDSIILNLYTNAVKAIRESDNRTKGHITIRLTTELKDLTVEVLDNGCGVTPEVASVMWEPIEGKFPEGTGMGLPITTFLAGLYGGDVTWVDSPEEGYKTLFRARLRGVLLE